MIELIYRYRQVLKFGIVGVLNTAVGFGLIFLFDKVMGMGFEIANPLAYFLSTLNSFYLNKKWTFKSDGKVHKEGAVFFAVIAVAWAIQYGLLYYLIDIQHMDELVAQTIGMVLFTGLNFLGQKFITFRA